jgi:hypothetical protein
LPEFFHEQLSPDKTMTMNRMLVLLVLGNILGFGGATALAVIGKFDFRGVFPAALFLLFLDVLAVRSLVRIQRRPATDRVAREQR